jgi:predicted enzyme related to lactoylglutathione lyase
MEEAMPTRVTAPTGAPCWVDLMTSDPARSRAFYGDLFGWDAEDPAEEFGGYVNFRKNDVRIAGCMQNEPGMPDRWSVYLASDDAAKTVESAADAGGQVIVPAMPVGDLGTMAFVTDPGGAGIGVWQPGEHKGFGLVAEAGAPAWFELFTRDHAAAVEFYRTVFGWDTQVASDTDEFRYTLLVSGDDQLAGVMDASGFLPEGVPPHWSVYFGADDVDATVARIVELGGAVVAPAEDTPYGRLATVTDPTGAQFKLVGPTSSIPADKGA